MREISFAWSRFLTFFLCKSINFILALKCLFSLVPDGLDFVIDVLDLLPGLIFKMKPLAGDFYQIGRPSAAHDWNTSSYCLVRQRAHRTLSLHVCVVADAAE